MIIRRTPNPGTKLSPSPVDERIIVVKNGPEQSSPSAAKTVKRSRRRLCRLIVKVVVVLFFVVVMLDMFYVQYRLLYFKYPCDLANDVAGSLQEAKGSLESFPKIIHQQWKDEKIPTGDFTTYHNAWNKLFPAPEYKHILWTDKTARELIANDFPWFLDAYDNYNMNIQRADATRYFVLYRYGGIYADLDYEPFVNFWNALPKDRVSLIESPYKVNERTQNSLMSSPKGHQFWNITFKVLFERRSSRQVLSSTGPAMLDAVLNQCPNSSWYHVLPCENFHRIPLGSAGQKAPLISRFVRTFLAYSPLVKYCGDWTNKDDCQYGLHHNSVSYLSKGSVLNILT